MYDCGGLAFFALGISPNAIYTRIKTFQFLLFNYYNRTAFVLFIYLIWELV